MTTKIPGFPGEDGLRLVDDVDPDAPFTLDADDPAEVPRAYRGPDRRRRHRRESPDRRAQVRYEPDKAPRRCGADRRQHSWKSISTI